MHPKKIDNLAIRTVGLETLVHDESNDAIHVLNETAGRVLELCDGTRSPDAIAREIAGACGIDPGMVAADVEEVLEHFVSLNLLQNETVAVG